MYTIRDATLRDVSRIEQLLLLGYKEGLLLKRPRREIELLARKKLIILAEAGTLIVGMVILDAYSKRLSELRSLFVLSDYRSTGVGKKLVHALIEKARKKGIKELLTITVKEKKHVFEKFGFTEEAHGFKVALFRKL